MLDIHVCLLVLSGYKCHALLYLKPTITGSLLRLYCIIVGLYCVLKVLWITLCKYNISSGMWIVYNYYIFEGIEWSNIKGLNFYYKINSEENLGTKWKKQLSHNTLLFFFSWKTCWIIQASIIIKW